LPYTSLFFFFYSYAHNRDLHSFPTRRSSDLYIQGFALWHVGNNIIHHYIGIVAFSQALHQCTADKASTHDGYFTSHRNILSLEKDRKSTRLNSSHVAISYAVFCLKKKKK